MNLTFNVSEVAKNLSDGLTQQFYGRQDFVMTTQDLLDVCGAFDRNAVFAATLGLISTIAFLFYLRRWRSKLDEKHQILIDKMTLTFVALCFAIVIVRILRGG